MVDICPVDELNQVPKDTTPKHPSDERRFSISSKMDAIKGSFDRTEEWGPHDGIVAELNAVKMYET